MKRTILAFLGLCILAACGADGEPIRPTFSTGISIGTGGSKINTRVGVKTGAITTSVGTSY